jgi:hypothetical protein
MGFTRVKGGYKYPKGYLYQASEGEETPDRWDYFEALFDRGLYE